MTKDSASHSTAPADTPFLPGPVLLLGAPGVGKGTQAQLLMAKYGIPQISTGDLLRANIASGSRLGLEAKDLMDRGQLVDDEIVNKMVANRLMEPDANAGFILDGYPRTRPQCDFLESFLLSGRHLQGSGPTPLPLIAVNIAVDEGELLRRITGRRSCSACRHIYNVYSHPPKQEGICDFDSSPLQQRSDDTEAAFHERMKEYRAKTEEVIHYFGEKKNLFANVQGHQSVEAVTASIDAALHQLRHASHHLTPAT